MMKITKAIKRLAVSALFINTICASELPDNHPIKTAVQMAKFAFTQFPTTNMHDLPGMVPGFGCYKRGYAATHGVLNHLLLIQKEVTENFKICVDQLFLRENEKNIFELIMLFNVSMNRESLPGNSSNINIGSTLDAISTEIDAYIHQSFERHFQLRRDKGKYAAAYNIAQVYLNHNTEHEENLAKANRWIEEIKTQARERVKDIGEVIYALFLERGLQAKQISKATHIIEPFKEVAPAFREELQTLLHDTAHKKRTFDPIAAERLIVYREMADALFECDDI